jgi:hypothetical protein
MVFIQIADDRQAGVVRDVKAPEERGDILHRRRFDVLHHADRHPTVRMLGRIEGFGKQRPYHAIRAICVILAVLVLDDILLDPQLLVVERDQQVGHPIRLHGDRPLGVRRGKIDEIVGPVRGRRSIDVCSQGLEMFKEVSGVMLGAFEHEMFEEVGESPLVPLFVLGTHVIPEVYRHQGESRLVADDHVEAIGQGFLGKPKIVEGVGIRHRIR